VSSKGYLHGYDKARGFDKYHVSDKPPADMATVSFTATFYTDTDGSLKLRTEIARDLPRHARQDRPQAPVAARGAQR